MKKVKIGDYVYITEHPSNFGIQHTDIRKGTVVGHSMAPNDGWVTVRFDGDHKHPYFVPEDALKIIKRKQHFLDSVADFIDHIMSFWRAK